MQGYKSKVGGYVADVFTLRLPLIMKCRTYPTFCLPSHSNPDATDLTSHRDVACLNVESA